MQVQGALDRIARGVLLERIAEREEPPRPLKLGAPAGEPPTQPFRFNRSP